MLVSKYQDEQLTLKQLVPAQESGGGTASLTVDDLSDEELLATCCHIREGTYFPGYIEWAINDFGCDDDDIVNLILTAESPDLHSDLVNFLRYVEEKKLDFKLTLPSMSSGKPMSKPFAPAPSVKLESNEPNNSIQPSLANTLPAVEPSQSTANGSPPGETQAAQLTQPAMSTEAPLTTAKQVSAAEADTLQPEKTFASPADKDQPATKMSPIRTEPAEEMTSSVKAQQTPLTEQSATASPQQVSAADAGKAQPESEKIGSPDKAHTAMAAATPETNLATVNATLPAEVTNGNTDPPQQQKVKTESGELLDMRSMINTVAFCDGVIDITSSQEEDQEDKDKAGDCSDDDEQFASMPLPEPKQDQPKPTAAPSETTASETTSAPSGPVAANDPGTVASCSNANGTNNANDKDKDENSKESSSNDSSSSSGGSSDDNDDATGDRANTGSGRGRGRGRSRGPKSAPKQKAKAKAKSKPTSKSTAAKSKAKSAASPKVRVSKKDK